MSEPMSNECCAHMHVDWVTQPQDDGRTWGWWECQSCSVKFVPKASARVLQKEIDRLRSQLERFADEAEAELAEAKEDGKRLDWLEKMKGWQGKSADVWFTALWVSDHENHSFRQAIDAARKESSNE